MERALDTQPPEGDYRAWQAYHEAAARQIVSEPAPANQMDRIAQLLGEMDHQAEAILYSELQQKEYGRQMAQAKQRGHDETRLFLDTRVTPYFHAESLAELQRQSSWARAQSSQKARSTVDEQAASRSLLSQDDYLDAYARGGKKAVQEWYFEQKEQHQLGRKYMPEQSQEATFSGADSEQIARKIVEQSLRERQLAIATETTETVAFSAVEAGAALNYLRGRAEEYNATREALIKHNPSLEKDLPPSLQIDEIRVRQVNIEREETQDRGLAVAR